MALHLTVFVDITSVYADPGIGTCDINVMSKKLPKQGCRENLMLYHWNFLLKYEVFGAVAIWFGCVWLVYACLCQWTLDLVEEVVGSVSGRACTQFPVCIHLSPYFPFALPHTSYSHFC